MLRAEFTAYRLSGNRPEEAIAVLRKAKAIGFDVNPNRKDADGKPYTYQSDSKYIDPDKLDAISEIAEHVELKPLKKLRFISETEKLLSSAPGQVRDIVNNTAQITIETDSLLHKVRHVTWLSDECTEQVQKMLDGGWRILAVLPQPGCRRPDYIFGRIDAP